jgi:hypothetical protein
LLQQGEFADASTFVGFGEREREKERERRRQRREAPLERKGRGRGWWRQLRGEMVAVVG